jgi:hypothetical protein
MKRPKFGQDQLILILIAGIVIIGLALWRSFTLYQ